MQFSQDLEHIIRYKHYPVDCTGFRFFLLISPGQRQRQRQRYRDYFIASARVQFLFMSFLISINK